MSIINYDSKSTMKHGFPWIKKLGAVSPNGEMTPFVHKGRLMRMELIDSLRGTDLSHVARAGIRDCETGRFLSYVGEGCYYFSAFTEGDAVYVLGVDVKSQDTIRIFRSEDLIHWEDWVLFTNPGWKYYNTALTKGKDGYVLLLEASEPKEYVGEYPFTFFFAMSTDLHSWKFLDYELGFLKDRYMGGPWMRYVKGWYYVISLTELPFKRYTNYLYRTRDFKDWEVGLYNPMLMPDEEDRMVSPNAVDLSEELLKEIKTGFLSSNSDIDLCDYQGKTYINYLVGNQLGFYYMAEAEYEGTVDQLLQSFFDESL